MVANLTNDWRTSLKWNQSFAFRMTKFFQERRFAPRVYLFAFAIAPIIRAIKIISAINFYSLSILFRLVNIRSKWLARLAHFQLIEQHRLKEGQTVWVNCLIKNLWSIKMYTKCYIWIKLKSSMKSPNRLSHPVALLCITIQSMFILHFVWVWVLFQKETKNWK